MGLCVLAALVLGDWLLASVAGRWPRWLLPEEDPIGWEGTETAARKVAGVAVEKRRRRAGTGEGLAVILGRSTAREGLDPSMLEAGDLGSLRWLSLYGSGGSLNFMTDLADILFFSKLNPEVVVLAINPYMLAGHPYRPHDPCGDATAVIRHLWGREFYSARIALSALMESRSWILAHRRIINHQVRVGSFRARLRLFRACGLEPDSLRPPDPDPWKVQRLGYPPHQSEDYLRWVLISAERLGRFSPSIYSVQSTQARALAEIITRSRQRGARVYVVLMPERSVWRKHVPAEADRCLQAVLGQYFGETPPPVIDLRASLADEMFSDHYHLNESGMKAASRLLALELGSKP